MYDVLIIGSGPAGISAALTLQQHNCHVAIVSVGRSPLTDEAAPLCYYGAGEQSGEQLYLNGIRQAKRLEIPMFEWEATGLAPQGDGFCLQGHTPLAARCVLLAMGEQAEAAVPDFARRFMKNGVHHHAEHDGFYYRNRIVGVLGGGPYAVAQALILARTARSVTLFTNDHRLTAVPAGLFVNRYGVVSLQGGERLEKITFENGTALNLDGLFLADRQATAADLCAGVGLQFDTPYVAVDRNGMTAVGGLFAAGDCTGATHSLPHKVYDGHRVATAIVSYLKGSCHVF